MEEEMVSGPDLGAGFLYQLTRAREVPRATFTFHAQEGGEDASGPPIGSPEPFGWARSTMMCPFGGRKCWHRSFDTEDRNVAEVRQSYNRSRFVMETLLAQAYRDAAVPWEAALEEWVSRVVPALEKDGAPWRLGGAAAARVRGGGHRVPGLTIWTTEPGVRIAALAIPEYLVEPAASTRWIERPLFAARAFVGTLREGTRVEWAAARDGSGAPALGATRLVDWHGRTIPVAPPE